MPLRVLNACSLDKNRHHSKGLHISEARMKRNCIQCGAELKKQKRFCGVACFAKWRSELRPDQHPRWSGVFLTCKVCGNEFHRKPAEVRKGAKYCSRECQRIGQPHPVGKTRVTCVCAVCGTQFNKFKYQVEHGEGKTCSRKCMGIYRSRIYVGDKSANWRGGNTELECQECGARFSSPKGRIQNGRGKFCSKVCFYAWHKRNFRGEVTGNWRGGIAYLPYPAQWNNWLKEQIRDRDSHKCVLCGKPENECKYPLSIHHIDYQKENLDPMNLISLCGSCHSKTNYHRDEWQAKLETMLKELYGTG